MKIANQFILALFLGASMFSGCRKMDSKYRDFEVPGGITYPGKAIHPQAHPGNGRIRLTWQRGSDSKVVKARIFWNNATDSVEVVVPPGHDTVSYTFENMDENIYTFLIRTYDDEGHVSIPVELPGTVYGSQYQAGLLNVAIDNAEADLSGKLRINWGQPDSAGGAFAAEVRYIATNGNTLIKKFDFATAGTSEIDDFKAGSIFSYRTLYLPDSLAIDTFRTDFETYTEPLKIHKADWTITASTYEPTGQLPNGPPEKAIDDDENTYWHSNHTTNVTGYPHWLAIDMKANVDVSVVELTSRPDYYKEDFTKFSIQGSLDGENWTDYGTFDMPERQGPQPFILQDKPVMRYVRIWMLQGVTVHSHLAEISVYGAFNNQ